MTCLSSFFLFSSFILSVLFRFGLSTLESFYYTLSSTSPYPPLLHLSPRLPGSNDSGETIGLSYPIQSLFPSGQRRQKEDTLR
ncbi:uncharacterized protein BDW47DRAFT_10100 [Aspergillus candidus]|uniref:Uncharacterized protein n=1 Tax=Aspergillus candidus TaxID=41067 RepID=A0A2I2EXP1_ASPCN|nr:hypothetical protein BDW47DRAFT_10100 [Aspergillus candidus]PLB33128.1 hypothetical protein BDW47DRAFT_10100 [Aspergillus candidus]